MPYIQMKSGKIEKNPYRTRFMDYGYIDVLSTS